MSGKSNVADINTFRVFLIILLFGVCIGAMAFSAGVRSEADERISVPSASETPTAEKTPPMEANEDSEDEHEELVNPGSRSADDVVRTASMLACSAPSPNPNSCGVERWSVKTGTDADIGLVNLNSASPTTITVLHGFASPDPTPANNRVAPAETTQWVIQGTLIKYKLEDDSDYHLVIQDGTNNTMVTEIPYPGNSPACVSASSPFLPGIASSRCKFDGSGLPIATGSFQTTTTPVRITGVGMFDFPHGQTGASPNQIEFHPIIDIAFPTTTATPTTTGSNVSAQLGDVTMTFTSVSIAGTTTSAPIEPSTSGTAPANNTLVGPAFNFSSTASFTQPVNTCISVPYITNATSFSRLNMLHLEGSTLVDRTTSRDTVNKKICGSLPSLGKTVISLGTGPTPTPTVTGTFTNTATPTATNTPAGTATNTATASPTPTRTNSATNTATNTNTSTPTNTPSASPTGTPTPASTLVLSQVSGGNGFYTNDWVEIKNISGATQSLNGLSLYYGSALGNFGAGVFALPNTSVLAGQYYLVQLGTGGGSNALPVTPDASTTNIFMSGASGKIGLVITSALAANTCGATATPCSSTQLLAFVDWVAYGAAGNGTANVGEGGNPSVNNGVALTSSQVSVRMNSGCQDTNDNNADFDLVTNSVPRNTSTALAPCSGVTPTNTPTLTATSTPTNTATITPTRTFTNTPTNTATVAPTPTFTSTPTFTPTNTSTATPVFTATNTATPTFTFSSTPTPAASATSTATPDTSISGTITYGNAIGSPNPRFVSNVLISGDGSPGVSDLSGFPSGIYTLTGFGPGAYTVTPTKSGGQNSITSFDAARVAQHVAGGSQLNANQLIVADVSGNGSVSSFDASQIARYVINAVPYGSTGSWRFLPVNRSFASVTGNIIGEDFTAYLMGEVSGNWTDSGARMVGGGPARAAAVELPQLVASAGQEMNLPVTVYGLTNTNVIAYEFDLRYDPAVIQPLSEPISIEGTASRALSYQVNASEPGHIRVAMYGTVPIELRNGKGVLFNLRFVSVGSSGSASPLVWDTFVFNEGSPQVGTTNGQVEITARAAD